MNSKNVLQLMTLDMADTVDTAKKKKMDTKDTDMAKNAKTDFMIVIGLEEEVYGLLLH